MTTFKIIGPSLINRDDFIEALKEFRQSARNLERIWAEIHLQDNPEFDSIGVEGYPKYLPSFNDFVEDVSNWSNLQELNSF